MVGTTSTWEHTRVSPSRRRATGWLAGSILLGIIGGLQTVDVMVGTVALVKASRDLGLDPALEAIAASISTLALAATVIAAGLIADRFGRRRVLLAALVLAAASDTLVALSPSVGVFLVGRACAGITLGAALSSAYAYVRVVAKDHLGTALGIFASGAMLTTLVGGLTGGLVAEHSWRAAFLVIPAGALVLWVPARLMLPPVPRLSGTSMDYPGLLLSGGGMLLLLLGISRMSTAADQPSTWLIAAAGLTCFAAFAWWENHAGAPMFPIRIFLLPTFVVAAVSGIGWNMAQAVATLQLSNLWQYVHEFSTGEVSLGQLPILFAGVATAILVGRMMGAGIATRSIMTVAFATTAAGFVGLALMHVSTPYWGFVVPMIAIGAGTTAVTVPQSDLFLGGAPRAFLGPVTSSRSAIGSLGYSIGLATSSVMVSGLTFGGVTQRLRDAGASACDVGAGIDVVNAYVRDGTQATTAAGRRALAVAADSYLSAFDITMLVVAGVMVAMAAMCWTLLRPRPADAATAAPDPGSDDTTGAASVDRP